MKLYQEAMTCERKTSESLRTFLDRFILAAQRYWNLIDADQDGVESQSFAFALFRNVRIAPTTFSSIVSGMVNNEQERENPLTRTTVLSRKRVEDILTILQECLQDSKPDKNLLEESAHAVQSARKAADTARSWKDSKFVSLASAITALESAALEENDVPALRSGSHEMTGRDQRFSKALLSDNQHGDNRWNRQSDRPHRAHWRPPRDRRGNQRD